MPALNKTRSMTWTLNNYIQEEIDHIKNGPFKFCVFQEEVGANGTPHLQGYCQMGNPTGFNTWRKLVSPRAHFEASRGSPRQNYEYCTKEQTRAVGTEFFQRGEVPKPGQRTDIEGLVLLAKEPTTSMRDLVESNPEGFIRYHRGLSYVRSIFSLPRNFQTDVYWLFGSTGTGKSKFAWEMAPGAYSKPGGTNWWDGYDPVEHTDIIIDDFRANLAPFSEILRLFDRYSMQVPFKGGYVNFRPRRIYVTTSKPPTETWLTFGEEDLGQLLRRLKVIVEFLPGGLKRFDKGSVADFEGAGHVPLIDPAGHIGASATTPEIDSGIFDGEGDQGEFDIEMGRRPVSSPKRGRFIVECEDECQEEVEVASQEEDFLYELDDLEFI